MFVPLGNFLLNYFVNTVLKPLQMAWTAIQIAVKYVGDGLSWIWNNLFVPFGNFLKDTLLAAWDAVCNGFQWLYDHTMKPVFDALTWVYNNVLKPIGDFLGGVGNALNSAGSAISGALGLNKNETTTTTSAATKTASANKQAQLDAKMEEINAAYKTLQALQNRFGASSSPAKAAQATLDALKDDYKKIQALASGGYFEANNPQLAIIGEGTNDEVASPIPILRQVFREEIRTTETSPPVYEIKPTINIYGNIGNGVTLAQVMDTVNQGVGEAISQFQAERIRRRQTR